jgi:hypothetical protein
MLLSSTVPTSTYSFHRHLSTDPLLHILNHNLTKYAQNPSPKFVLTEVKTAMSSKAYVPLSLLTGSQFHNYYYSFLLAKLLYTETAKPNEAKKPPSLLSSAESHTCQVLQLPIGNIIKASKQSLWKTAAFIDQRVYHNEIMSTYHHHILRIYLVIRTSSNAEIMQCTMFFAQCGVESKLGPLGTSATYWPIVPALGDCEDGEFVGINGRGNRSTRRKPALTPLCPPQIPLDQTQD